MHARFKKIFESFTPAKVAIYQNIHSSDLVGFLMYAGHMSEIIFSLLKQVKWVVWSLGFFCTSPAICDVLCEFFEMNSKNLLDLLITMFPIINNGLFSSGERRKCKISALIPACYLNWPTLSCRGLKTFQLLVKLFRFLIELLSLLPVGLLSNSKAS